MGNEALSHLALNHVSHGDEELFPVAGEFGGAVLEEPDHGCDHLVLVGDQELGVLLIPGEKIHRLDLQSQEFTEQGTLPRGRL